MLKVPLVILAQIVAPHAGAWIETYFIVPSYGFGKKSPPTRGRGLKPAASVQTAVLPASPPTRGRGLKLDGRSMRLRIQSVAPHAGAWIETTLKDAVLAAASSRPPRGGVD